MKNFYFLFLAFSLVLGSACVPVQTLSARVAKKPFLSRMRDAVKTKIADVGEAFKIKQNRHAAYALSTGVVSFGCLTYACPELAAVVGVGGSLMIPYILGGSIMVGNASLSGASWKVSDNITFQQVKVVGQVGATCAYHAIKNASALRDILLLGDHQKGKSILENDGTVKDKFGVDGTSGEWVDLVRRRRQYDQIRNNWGPIFNGCVRKSDTIVIDNIELRKNVIGDSVMLNEVVRGRYMTIVSELQSEYIQRVLQGEELSITQNKFACDIQNKVKSRKIEGIECEIDGHKNDYTADREKVRMAEFETIRAYVDLNGLASSFGGDVINVNNVPNVGSKFVDLHEAEMLPILKQCFPDGMQTDELGVSIINRIDQLHDATVEPTKSTIENVVKKAIEDKKPYRHIFIINTGGHWVPCVLKLKKDGTQQWYSADSCDSLYGPDNRIIQKIVTETLGKDVADQFANATLTSDSPMQKVSGASRYLSLWERVVQTTIGTRLALLTGLVSSSVSTYHAYQWYKESVDDEEDDMFFDSDTTSSKFSTDTPWVQQEV